MSVNNTEPKLVWFRALEPDELPEGRVKAVTCALQTVCMTHYQGRYAALDNKCPHQGGPLGEGSIEKGILRCPWHGWDFDPLTGKAPGYDDGVEAFGESTCIHGGMGRFPGPEIMALAMGNAGKLKKFGA